MEICEIMGWDLMNKKMGLLGLIGLLSFMFGIYISQWTIFGIVMGIGGGIIMGVSSTRLLK